MTTAWERTKMYLGLLPAGEQPLGHDRTWYQRFVTAGEDTSTRSLVVAAVLFGVVTIAWAVNGWTADTMLERIAFCLLFVFGSIVLVWPRLRLLAHRWT